MRPLATLLVILSLVPCTWSRIHKLSIENDDRQAFTIEPFGFNAGGSMELVVKGFKLSTDVVEPFELGFIARRTESTSTASSKLLQDTETNKCSLTDLDAGHLIFTIDAPLSEEEITFTHIFDDQDAGLYDLEFERCVPNDLESTVSFELDATFMNPGPNYLSAGEAPLPVMFLVFAFIFYWAAIAWGFLLMRNRKDVQKVHFIMAGLVFVKACSVLLDSITYHYMKKFGEPIGWNYADEIVKAIKGMMMFGVILLIGTGWSFLKPFINEREKRIVCIVIPLQVVANIAMIWLDESAPGSQEWITWKDILALADIICCCAVLFPIVWSIRHLRDASQADGKVNVNLVKLKQFRHFYVLVVSYIYFTRIVVFLLQNTLPYKYLWFSFFSREFATLMFYSITGYYFRPVENNPYLQVRTADDEDDQSEFGLSETVMEL